MDDKSSDINFTPDEFFKQANHKEINDIDELNDETFGNLDGEDPNAWESFHFGVVNQNDDQKNENEPPNKLLSKFDSFTIKDLWDNNNPTVADVNLETSKIWSSSDILPPPKPQQNTTPKAITLEDLEKDLLMSSPTPPAAVGSSSHSPSHTHDHFSHTRTHPLPPSQVPYIGVPVPSRGGMYVRHPPPGPYPPASQYNRYPRPHPQYIGRPIHPYMVRGPPPPIRLPPNLSLMGPPRVIPRPLVRSHHPPVIHPPYGPMMMTNPVGFPLHSLPPPPPFLMSKTYELLCDLKPDGSGFMTNKEKEWIIKVQLLQLHTSTPEIDDYYYQNFVQKKMHKNVGEGAVLVAKQPRMNLPPPVTKNENRRKLPTEFEGSLGKVNGCGYNLK
jgi:DNA topoisomerase 2-associated protein PAT1